MRRLLFCITILFVLGSASFAAPFGGLPIVGAEESLQSKIPFKAERNFLLVPMSAGEDNSKFALLDENGDILEEFSGLFTQGKAEWFSSIDISKFKGRDISFAYNSKVRGVTPSIRQSDSRYIADWSKFEGRPKFHLTADSGRMEGLVGIIYDGSLYHAFFEHNPFSVTKGNYIEWAHATSSDLISWTQIDPVLEPTYNNGKWISPRAGSILLDSKNESGLFKNNKNRWLAIASVEGKGDVLYAFDSKLGKFRELSDFSVAIAKEGLEPSLYRDGNKWIIIRREAIGKSLKNPSESPSAKFDESFSYPEPIINLKNAARSPNKEAQIEVIDYASIVYTSENLRDWKKVCQIDGLDNHPMLARIPVTGKELGDKWVAFDGRTNYIVGNFDGVNFKRESKYIRQLAFGDGVTARLWQGLPNGRQIFSMVLEIPDFSLRASKSKFGQGMSLPWDFSLVSVASGELQLRASLPKEIMSRTLKAHNALSDLNVAFLPCGSNNYTIPSLSVNNVIATGEVDVGTASSFFLSMGTIDFYYSYLYGDVDVSRSGFDGVYSSRRQKPLSANIFKFDFVTDNTSFEFLFGSGDLLLAVGESLMTPNPIVRIGGNGGNAKLYLLMLRFIFPNKFM